MSMNIQPQILLPKDSFIPLTGVLREDLNTLENYLNNDEKLFNISDKAYEWVNDYVDG